MKLLLNKNKLILYLLATLLMLIFLFIKDFNINSELGLKTDFKKDTHYFTILKPQARINNNQAISEPIYFDVKVPSAYDSVQIFLDYSNPFNQTIGVGLIDPNENPYLQTIYNSELNDESINQNPDFKLWIANSYRFVISIPNMTNPIEIKGVTLIFHKNNNNLLEYLYLWVKRYIK